MGIKDLWEVIEPAERQYTLEELASDRAQRSDAQQLRIAIDIALWTFQARSSKGGRSPELRMMFYRFCRLQELGIRAVFVFDGPGRPSWKRDREINTAALDTEFRQALMTMIRLFDFYVWHAYGEAEAECAVLARLGYVDMVMTGDVDAFLFGAKRVIRQWPAKRLTTVPCYDMAWINSVIALDRSDLILMALLRGSDYSHGSMQVGIRIAEALARCKKHVALMKYVQNDNDDDKEMKLQDMADELRDALSYELRTGCSGNSQRLYTRTTLDDDDNGFPDMRILRDFVNPKTKIQQEKADNLAQWFARPAAPDWKELAVFCKEGFHWSGPYTLRRFSSLVLPGYFTWRLRKIISYPHHDELTTVKSRTTTAKTGSPPTAKRAKTSSSSSQQSHVDSFFSVTKLDRSSSGSSGQPVLSKTKNGNERDSNPSDDSSNIVLRVYNEKKVRNLKMYYVEFDINILTEFMDGLKSHLDGSEKGLLFGHIFEPPESHYLGVDSDDDDDDDVDTDVALNEKDPKKLCRRWVHAELIDMTYPGLVKDYQFHKAEKERAKAAKGNKKKKNNSVAKNQRLLTDYIVIPD